jgi:hypothetical protein
MTHAIAFTMRRFVPAEWRKLTMLPKGGKKQPAMSTK